MANGALPAAGARAQSLPPATKQSLQGVVLFAAIAVGVTIFVAVLDTTISNVSVPTIAGALGISSTQGTWIITSYDVAQAITVRLTGFLTKRFGAQRTFLFGFAMFVAFFATLVILPLWPQQNMGYAATQVRYATGVMGIFAVLIASMFGKLTETVDPRLLGLDPRIFSLGRAYLADPPPHGADQPRCRLLIDGAKSRAR